MSDRHRFLAADFVQIFNAVLLTATAALGNTASCIPRWSDKSYPHLQQCLYPQCEKWSTLMLQQAGTPLSLCFGRRQRAYLHPFNYLVHKRTRSLRHPETQTCDMHCCGDLVNYLSCGMILTGLGHLVHHRKVHLSYGRHMGPSPPGRTVPARLAWFLQEMPALLIPLLLMLTSHKPSSLGKYLLLGTFCVHYFQRTFVYSLLTRGRPSPLGVMVAAGFFCSLNGFLQGHYLLHCAHFDDGWSADYRYKTGLLLFYTGMTINIHSDYILRNLRKPGEIVYRIPTGGLFEYVSGANYLGEIVEWFGYAVATWSLPALSFAVFTSCFIGSRAYHHHRFYREKFPDYPKLRKALIPFVF